MIGNGTHHYCSMVGVDSCSAVEEIKIKLQKINKKRLVNENLTSMVLHFHDIGTRESSPKKQSRKTKKLATLWPYVKDKYKTMLFVKYLGEQREYALPKPSHTV